jgi:starvation-inducible DNA-binding protein
MVVMTDALHETRIDISASARAKLVALLNRQLADALDLYTQAKYAHWNVKGSDFIQLHELFDAVAGHVLEYTDLIAERATTLGGTATGTVRMAATATTLSEFPTKKIEGIEAVDALAEQVAAYAESTRRAMRESEELGDMSTNDLFVEVSRQIDKDLWFLEAHLQTA